ncbi:MAG: glutathione S-transferase family protein, partial [Nitratireductor sp.]|nr:glutathione S-transferase family protein [Nitratireductor sp.]
ETSLAEGLRRFRENATLLDGHLAGSEWLLGDVPSYADFRMATFLPYNDFAGLPLDEFPALSRWNGRLEAIDAWRDPFAGLSAPPLPPIPRG